MLVYQALEKAKHYYFLNLLIETEKQYNTFLTTTVR